MPVVSSQYGDGVPPLQGDGDGREPVTVCEEHGIGAERVAALDAAVDRSAAERMVQRHRRHRLNTSRTAAAPADVKQALQLPQTDRATRCVRRNMVNRCTTAGTSCTCKTNREQIEVTELEG